MEVAFAFLADSASAPPDGKIYVLGAGFDSIGVTTFPAIHPVLSLVLKLRLHPIECDQQHRIKIQLWDADGKVLTNLEGGFIAQRNPQQPTRPGYAQLILNFQGLAFEKAGEYEFHVMVDDHHLTSIPLYIDQIEINKTEEPSQ